ncbi:hypothetical protein Fuma_00582 [Fuerstiella marisgermanici]|uniref:Uncharacterized protein n=1 Tax=Fuerstiella marisgermanici TaxID=1891926 RepID=A0A1P8WAB2_9PLAN|nr:hypothetical protein Fuma_00582 [Fuerstiella marisgermanici]
MSSTMKAFYHCVFCRDGLKPVPLRNLTPIHFLLAMMAIRIHRCPHCFCCVFRLRPPFLRALMPWKWFETSKSSGIDETVTSRTKSQPND